MEIVFEKETIVTLQSDILFELREINKNFQILNDIMKRIMNSQGW